MVGMIMWGNGTDGEDDGGTKSSGMDGGQDQVSQRRIQGYTRAGRSGVFAMGMEKNQGINITTVEHTTRGGSKLGSWAFAKRPKRLLVSETCCMK
jgi:hypothetical protein